MPNRLVRGWLIASIGIGLLYGGHVTHAQPTFRTGVELVSVAAVVSDKGGRPVRELTRDDFQVFDDGERRPVIEFWADNSAALSLAPAARRQRQHACGFQNGRREVDRERAARATEVGASDPEVDEEFLKRLRTLGYFD